MQTITCHAKINDFHIGNKSGVTPTEALILEQLHGKEAGGKCIRDAVLSGDATEPLIDKKTGAVKGTRERTNAEEVIRLKSIYRVPAKSKAPGTHILDDLYPGRSPNLPKTFSEVGIIVADKPPEEAEEEEKRPESEATIDGDPVKTPVANPPVAEHLKHANELMEELKALDEVPLKDLTKAQIKRLKELSVLRPPAPVQAGKTEDKAPAA